MGCCLLTLIGLLVPRILMIFILLLTDWFDKAYDSFIWPFLGFIFMPYTTLAYMAAMVDSGLNGGWIVLLIVAVLADLGCMGSGSVNRNKSCS